MIKLIRFFCAAALLAGIGAAHAVTPSRGLWWNPDENGRGYEFDRQGGTMTLTVYAYDATGAATWYVGAGAFDMSSGDFDTDVSSFVGGQCLGCAYTPPSGTPYGTLHIHFFDPEHASLEYPGGSISIEHFNYGYASKQDRLLGYWSFAATIGAGNGTGPQTLGEFLLFDSHFTAADGTLYVSGSSFTSDGVTALGTYSETDDSFDVIVTLPDGTEHHYADMTGDETLLIGLSSYGPGSTSTTAAASRLEYYSPPLQAQPTTPASIIAAPVRSARH